MRILICGGRDYADTTAFSEAMFKVRQKHPGDVVIINGGAPGSDKLARAWAMVEELDCEIYPARWTREGNAAGPKRNQRMIDLGHPQAAVAFPGGTGTTDMVRRLLKAGIPVWIPYGGVQE